MAREALVNRKYDVPLVYEYPRDPKDEPYINLAIAAGVDHITSAVPT